MSGYVAYRVEYADGSGARTLHCVSDPRLHVSERLLDALEGISSPRLVGQLRHHTEGGTQYLLGEVAGPGLTGARLPPWRATAVMADVLSALRVLHARGVVHRFVSPACVCVGDDGRASLASAASGEMLGPDGLARSSAGFLYASAPEVISNSVTGQGFDCKCDVWSLAVTVFEAATGELPFDADDDHQLAARILASDPDFGSPACGALSPGLRDVLSAMLTKAPESRPSAEECLAMLGQIAP